MGSNFRVVALATSLLAPLVVEASPWLEADNVFLRGDLQKLADAGVIQSAVNVYPLPWKDIGIEIKATKVDELRADLILPFMHVRHAFESDVLGRGDKSVGFSGSTEATPGAFGQNYSSRWSIDSSYAITEKRFAMRVNANYGYYHGEKPDFNYDGSFLALNAGDFSFNAGALKKWWGPTWQSSLMMGTQTRPDLAGWVSYGANNIPLLRSVYLETGIAWVEETSPFKYSWDNRLTVRPSHYVEFGFSATQYKDKTGTNKQWWLWYDVLEQSREDAQQISADLRFSPLPELAWQPGLYVQYMVSDNTGQEQAFIVGVDSQFNFKQTQMRLVLEYRDNPMSKDQSLNKRLSNGEDIKNGHIFQIDTLSDQLSLGSYVQLENNHKFSVFYHRESYQQSHNRVATEYQMPLVNGLFKVQVALSDAEWVENKAQLSGSWEYRF